MNKWRKKHSARFLCLVPAGFGLSFLCLVPPMRSPVADYSPQVSQMPTPTPNSTAPFASCPNFLSPSKDYGSADPADLSEFNLDGCQQIYLDIGSNVGVQVRKLFEPQKYRRAPALHLFDAAFGPPEHRSRPSSESGLCAVGFEANPDRVKRLHEIEDAYRKQGWRVHFFAPRPVSAIGGQNLTLFLNPFMGSQGVGASVTHKDTRNKKGNGMPFIVKSFDLTAWIQRNIVARSLPNIENVPAYVLAKMDIEGSEYDLLTRMIHEKLLCAGVIDELFIEWHRNFIPGIANKNYTWEELLDYRKCVDRGVRDNLDDTSRCLPKAISKTSKLDDEKYMSDTLPLPR